MKIKYQFATETVEIEVADDWGNLVIDLNRQEYNIDHKETRRHISLDAALFEGDVFAVEDPTLENFADNQDQRQGMTLIAGFKSARDILFKDDFASWRERMNLILTLDSGEETEQHKIGLVTKYIPDLKLENVSKAVAIVVGPPAMMRFSVKGLLECGFKEENIWISHERKMCCGLGKCGHCKVNDTYICLDGPVFNYTKGKTLID